MLALQQAYEIQASILEYLKATFGFKDREVGEAFYKFLTDPVTGIFKGPYVSLKLPFEKVTKKEQEALPLEVLPGFLPFHHQAEAFRRLSARDGHGPEATLLTTGTGSGKTESFLYPLLDYCLQESHRKGIKAIILYPMNALASDQSARMAKVIYKDDRLRGKVTAGLFIGEGKDAKKYPKAMGPNNIIENRNAILDSPPDILLTNFRMLDYGLMRSNYHALWTCNLQDPGLLRFLVLDELHTYDGAQGTDVANLIRRLKLKLNVEEGQLCPVGTSATIGTGPDARQLLAEYASTVFGEQFEEAAIIGETRLSPSIFIEKEREELVAGLPSVYALRKARISREEDYDTFLVKQFELWQIDPMISSAGLGKALKALTCFADLVAICSEGIILFDDLVLEMSSRNSEFRKIGNWDPEGEFSPQEAVLQSLLALTAAAKLEETEDFSMPLLNLQVQLWIREVSGLLRLVQEEPAFTWRDKADPEMDEAAALPAWFCRECGASGWLGVKHENKRRFEPDVLDTYAHFFQNHKNLFFFNTHAPAHEANEEYQASEQYNVFLGNRDLNFYEKAEGSRTPVIAYQKTKTSKSDRRYTEHFCPECNTRNTVNIIGTRVATLSSIATSQVLASDLDPRAEKSRKLLAFTNSVQDAAHQAGFLEARNYRFSFRSALQQVIKKHGGNLPLNDLARDFITHWKANAAEGPEEALEAYLYKFFPPKHRGEVNIADYKEKNGKFDPLFIREFDLRVQWEIASEFGYNSIIGRTLEKTGSSAIGIEEAKLDAAWELLQPWLKENHMQQMAKADFKRFLFTFLNRLRIRGGISHAYLSKFRTGNFRLWDLNWMRDGQHYLNPRYGKQARFPKMLTAQPESRDLVDSTFSKSGNWYHSHFKKSFLLLPNYVDALNEFLAELIRILIGEEVSLLDKVQGSQLVSHALKPEALFVSADIRKYSCQRCGHTLHLASQSFAPGGAKCMVYRCTGEYRENPAGIEENYYQMVYNRQRSPRIYAAEHTGILERKDRENKERSFKERPKFNSLNALVATSTLEMGIDVGDLDVAMNTSVPPMPANFLQRVGRAGRASGSALLVNFSLNQPHDLFYYEGPTEMMEGTVSTPGCYLDAKEILARHFFAFCIDTWTSENPELNVIPSLVRWLGLVTLDLTDSRFFLNRILSFIKSKESDLLKKFRSIYHGEIQPGVFNALAIELKHEAFYLKQRRTFEVLKEEYHQLREKSKDIKEYIKTCELKEGDDDHTMLVRESRAIYGTIKTIEKRRVLEHMTNAGVLPNYAFPETGVTLNARVMPRKSEGSKSVPIPKDIELVRPARSAIRELAPDNYFYTQGQKLRVTGLNILNWNDPDQVSVFRYCSNCDHLEEAVKAVPGPCPKCGHESWSADSNQHHFARLKMVKSFNDEAVSALDDSKDEREAKFSSISTHFRFPDQSSGGAWVLESIPFGIEFVSNVEIFQVNTGIAEFMGGRTSEMNSERVSAHGFITCKYCGRSSSTTYENNQPKEARHYHYSYCKYRDKAYNGKQDTVFAEVYLYRKMQTEAIKILLPVQELEHEAQVAMFMAGIQLGLKRYFKGNPQHIEISHYSEFNAQSLKTDRFLIMYDQIPGGTGYLEKLLQPDSFTELIRGASEAIAECHCQHEGKDGCYHCIFTYTNQYIQEDLSRKGAEQIFQKILDATRDWDFRPYGLGSIVQRGKIEESELENRFVRAMNTLCDRKKALKEDWKWTEINQAGQIWYGLQIRNGQRYFDYLVIPQHSLGAIHGVQYATRPDFLIKCTFASVDDNPVGPESLHGFKSIAVYLDGYYYHASADHYGFDLDLQRRMGLLDSGEYLCWVMGWSDLDHFEQEEIDVLSRQLSDNRSVNDKIKKHPIAKGLPLLTASNSMERLAWLLSNYGPEEDIRYAFDSWLSCFQTEFGKPSFELTEAAKYVKDFSEVDPNAIFKSSDACLYLSKIESELGFVYRVFSELKTLKPIGGIRIDRVIGNSINKESWENFWRWFNAFQFFLRDASLEMDQESITLVANMELKIEEHIPAVVIEEWKGYFEQEFHPLLDHLGRLNIHPEQVADFVLKKGGRIVAEAAFGFDWLKLVIEPKEDHITEFEKQGYTVLFIHQLDLNLIRK